MLFYGSDLWCKQGCELEAFLIEFEFTKKLQVQVQVQVFLNFNFSSSSSQNRVEKIQSE